MKWRRRVRLGPLFCCLLWGPAAGGELPGGYFRLLEAGAKEVENRLQTAPNADLKTLEADPDWRHFPYAILAPAVLYAKRHPQNPRYRDPGMLALAIRLGDLLAGGEERGTFETRVDT